MPSVQRFLSGRNNLVRDAVLSASSVRASTAIERVAASRTGGGRVRLAGAYTGHEAAQVEVEIAAAGGIPRASVPKFVGVGNGQLEVLAVDGAAPLQSLSLTLADLGIPTEHARLDAREVQIRARAAGALGNAIRITVEPRLARTATTWALLTDWSAGTAVQFGSQWDFGGLPLSSKSELDANSPRIQFGFDPQVYRPWRQFKDGAWQFGVSPALERNLSRGTPVYSVTGGYVLTVTDGVATETYGDVAASQPQIRTFYDLLAALQSSALVDVAGVVAADRTVGGQAAVDVPLRTQAWLYAIGGKVQLQGVAVPPAAPTQSLRVRCINADVVGVERWSVEGDVSGVLPVATTGEPYTSAAAQFLVPAIDPASLGSGRWSFKYEPIARLETEGLPSVCVRPFRFGRNARARTVTFRYAQRPPADCKCTDMPTPVVSLACLGLFDGEGLTMDPALQTRLKQLYEWRRDFMGTNTVYPSASVSFLAHGVFPDMDLADALTREFVTALNEVYENAAAATEWDAALVSMKTDMAPIAPATGNLADLGQAPSAFPTDGTEADKQAWRANRQAQLVRRYSARMDHIRVLAGIAPKSESSGGNAGGCWTDHGDTHWWVDVDGYYLPAFTNQGYVSARRNTETGEPYSTAEFGFGLVAACPDRLKVGDQLTIRIEQVDGDRPYQVGDEAVIQTIAAGPAWLAGGVDGTDEQTWRVAGSVSGMLADYMVPTDGSAAPVYSTAGVDLQLALGGIPFTLGDAFTLAIEAGQYRWRRDGGAWSALADIPPAGQDALPDGLVVHFEPGAAPSFVPGDAYAFDVHQPWAVSHAANAAATAWGWAGSGASIVIDLGLVRDLSAVALARYDLPEGAQVTAEISNDGAAWAAPVAMDVARVASVLFLAGQARYLRVTVANAEGGSIGWIWAGQPLATDHHASTCQRRRRWAVGRGNGFNPAGLYAGVGDGWSLGWSPADTVASRLLEPDIAQLVALLDWAQEVDEPLLFVPHHLHPQDASLVRFAADALAVGDIHEYQPDAGEHRLLSATLELEPVFA